MSKLKLALVSIVVATSALTSGCISTEQSYKENSYTPNFLQLSQESQELQKRIWEERRLERERMREFYNRNWRTYGLH